MNKKVLIGGTILAAGVALILFKDKLFGTNQVSTGSGNSYAGGSNSDTGAAQLITGSPYEDMVVRSPGNDNGWYRVVNGQRVVYLSDKGYNADGSRPIVDLPIDELKQIPANTQQYINDSGQITRW
ncbi:hypothetical protein V1389_01920 [Flavobacterium rakeshii]|uniref:hypothetical protein n=1 Tax=Flavobacterium rakeshii TaxID=1038845 RepID=UPI002E7B8672|nr:hypothetical protein [Flavobacterium rakeshii]MEE1897073.1 hypothetical protein [Flavobacterium rakeshii]